MLKLKPQKLLFTLLILALLAPTFVFPVLAQEVEANSTSNQGGASGNSGSGSETRPTTGLPKDEFEDFRNMTPEERKAAIDSLRAMKKSQRCERVKANISKRLTHYQTNRERHRVKFGDITEKLGNALDRLDQLGVDVSELEPKLAQVRTLSAELTQLDASVNNSFQLLKGEICDLEPGSTSTNLEDAKEGLADIRVKTKEIRDILSGEIKVAFEEIKAQLQTSTSTESST